MTAKPFKVVSTVFESPLNQIKDLSSSFRLIRSINPVYQHSQPNLAPKTTVQPDTLRVDWFNFRQNINKENKSCCINRLTPRTDRQSQWNLLGMGTPSTSKAISLLGKGGRYVFNLKEDV